MLIRILKLLLLVILLSLLFVKRKIIFEKIKKRKNSIFGKYRWLKRKILKNYEYFKTKYFILLFLIKKILLMLLIIICLIFVLFIFFKSINVLQTENNQLKFDYETINLKLHHYDFLWAQISSTLIVSTIIGFLGVFSTSYVYGKKQINVIFKSKGIFTLSKMFIYLVILIFVSLINCINEGNSFTMLMSFTISLLLIFYMLFRILIFYAFPEYYENNLKYEYLTREKKHIKKAMPLMPYRDAEIENFKYRTMELIQANNNEYNKNIRALMDLLNISFFNNSKNIQEYYTEMINRTDFMASLLEIIQHLITYDKIIEADTIMDELYSKLKYHRIVPVQEPLSFFTIKSLIFKGKDIKDETNARKHYKLLWSIINKYTYLLYLYFCELDLSYCRLGKIEKNGENNIFFITENMYLEYVYQSICENIHLTEIEKERIFDDLYNNIRMMEIIEKHPSTDVRQANEYMPINKNKISIPLIIKGEPLVLMFLKMFENNDIRNLKSFITMNLSDELMEYIITLTTLSLIEFINKGCIRKYVYDLNTTEKNIIDNYSKSKFGCYLGNSKSLYEILNDNYIKNQRKENKYFMFTPKLILSIETIDNYYYYRYVIKDNNDNEFKKIVKDNKFIPNDKIIEIIKRLGI